MVCAEIAILNIVAYQVSGNIVNSNSCTYMRSVSHSVFAGWKYSGVFSFHSFLLDLIYENPRQYPLAFSVFWIYQCAHHLFGWSAITHYCGWLPARTGTDPAFKIPVDAIFQCDGG